MAAEADAGRAGPGLAKSRRAVLQWLSSHVIRRLSWGIADQIVSSLSNFAVGIYVVHTLGAVQFGAFSLAYVTYGFALNASRGLSTDPLMVRFSGTDLPTWRRAAAKCYRNRRSRRPGDGGLGTWRSRIAHRHGRGEFPRAGTDVAGTDAAG